MEIERGWQKLKNIYHWIQASLWRFYFGYPDKSLEIYGVTGTNGKTTTAHLLGSVLSEAYGRDKVGLLSTIAFWIGREERINTTKMTTLNSRDVFRYLKKMKEAGVEKVVLEVTSHALDQNRLAGIRLAGAIWLNLAREHLDYHKSMKNYALAKKRILAKVEGVFVAKRDDKWVAKMVSDFDRVVWFKSEDAQKLELGLEGAVNRENGLAVSLLAKEIGIRDEVIKKGLMRLKSLAGRNEWLENAKGVRVVIDYAVTPDALRRLYQDVREKTDGRVWGILGACGLRDRGKRPQMGKIVAELSDFLVLTREDPWTESEEQIYCDLEEGLVGQKNWKRIEDRREAIKYCLTKAENGDVVVVTGKGAETGMAIGREVIAWNDKQVILELFEDMI